MMTEEAAAITNQKLYVLLKGSLNEKTLELLDTKFGFTIMKNLQIKTVLFIRK